MARLRHLALPTILAVGLLFAPAPAWAQAEQIVVVGKKMPRGYGPVQQIVKIGDLNLGSPTGVAAMEKRVSGAVSSICRINAPINASNNREAKTCREFAWASARPQMDRAVRAANGR